jgi:non-ribosomal peptide synthetase component E (peptide arylation enzyme)
MREYFRALGVDAHKVPEQMRVIRQLPRTALGKVAKEQLRRQLE